MANRRFIYWEVEGGVLRFTRRKWKAFLEASLRNDDAAPSDYSTDVCVLDYAGYLDRDQMLEALKDLKDQEKTGVV